MSAVSYLTLGEIENVGVADLATPAHFFRKCVAVLTILTISPPRILQAGVGEWSPP